MRREGERPVRDGKCWCVYGGRWWERCVQVQLPAQATKFPWPTLYLTPVLSSRLTTSALLPVPRCFSKRSLGAFLPRSDLSPPGLCSFSHRSYRLASALAFFSHLLLLFCGDIYFLLHLELSPFLRLFSFALSLSHFRSLSFALSR